MTKVQIRPGVGLLSLFPNMNYRPWYALGEFVDNSIQSYLDHKDELRELHGLEYRLRINITYVSGERPEILVEDNAAGIYERDIERAFTPAVRPFDRSGISQFGIGMKSAAAWYSNFYTVTTTALGETIRRQVTLDIAEIVSKEIEELPVIEEIAMPEEHGTRIVMRDLHQGIPVGRTRSKIIEYLSSIYRDFVKSGEMVLSINETPIAFNHPKILKAPYWPTEKGPIPGAESRHWKMPIDITLEDSWSDDKSPNRPDVAPRIRGWMAILETGATKQSGLALVWKRKVVVGAGSLAEGDDDSYKPARIFGASTTFPYQRLFGEIDVSQLQVTTFKDQIDWRNGQQEELQEKMHAALRAGDEPLISMANNYRSTAKTKDAKRSVEESARSAASAAREGFTDAFSKKSLPINSSEEVIRDSAQIESSTQVSVPSLDNGFTLEVVTSPGAKWLVLVPNDSGWIVQINRSHPFMNSFANLPGADLDPVFRLAMALALSEIKVKNTGMVDNYQIFRRFINDSLEGDLSQRKNTNS